MLVIAAAAGDATTRASARIGLFPPMAIFIMVQLFTALSNRFGIRSAYLLMTVTVTAAIAAAMLASRRAGARA